jgi:hypothetical protein
VRGLALRAPLTSHLSLIKTRPPPYGPRIRFNDVFCVASHAAIIGFGGAGRHQLSVGGATAGANPFRRRGRIAHLLCRSSSGGQLLQGPANKLGRLSRCTGCERGSHRIVSGRYSIAQPHQGLDRIL